VNRKATDDSDLFEGGFPRKWDNVGLFRSLGAWRPLPPVYRLDVRRHELVAFY